MLARFRAGDDTAASTLYHRFGRALIRVIRRCFLPHHSPLRSLLDSDDLAQEAWASMFDVVRKGRTMPSEEDFFRLLTGIVRNHFRYHRRAGATLKRSLSREEPLGPALRQRLASGDDPAAEAEAAEAWKCPSPVMNPPQPGAAG